MKKLVFSMLPVFACLIILIASGWSQEEMAFVDNSVFNGPRRTPSVFNHDAHNTQAELEDDCSECHHLYDENGDLVEGESSEDQSCSECHDLKSSDSQPPLMKAFHTNCRGCHVRKGKGPVMCGACHKK